MRLSAVATATREFGVTKAEVRLRIPRILTQDRFEFANESLTLHFS